MSVTVEWRSGSKACYTDFCKLNPEVKLTYKEWSAIIYKFNEEFRDHILETGEKIKLPQGIGYFTIKKKKRRKSKGKDGKDFINLPVDWKKTKEKGKIIYNFNFHTEGFFFGWNWFKSTASFKHSNLWFFKASRVSSRLIKTYIDKDPKYQDIYVEWIK